MLWVSKMTSTECVYGHTFEERITSDIKHLETHNGSYDKRSFHSSFFRLYPLYCISFETFVHFLISNVILDSKESALVNKNYPDIFLIQV